MRQLNPQPLVKRVKPQKMQSEILANQSISRAITQFGHFKRHIWGDKEHISILHLLWRQRWEEALHSGLVHLFLTSVFFIILHCDVFIAPTATKYNKGQSSFILYVFFPLCWIPRHSPKVVKAASQVLNSMWQYRDLRSLYKKVKPAWPNVLWLY